MAVVVVVCSSMCVLLQCWLGDRKGIQSVKHLCQKSAGSLLGDLAWPGVTAEN